MARTLPFPLVAFLLAVMAISAAEDAAAASSTLRRRKGSVVEEDEEKKDPTDELIKYKGLLQCKMCEDAVESLTRAHFSTPLGTSAKSLHRSNPKVEAQRTLLARNTELVDGLCGTMMAAAEKEGDQGTMGTIQQHCQTIVNEEEEKLVKYLSTLYTESGIELDPAQLRTDDKGKVHYASEAKVDRICSPHCGYKTKMKQSIANMKEDMMQKHRELAANISFVEIFQEAFGLMAEYWYLTGGFFIVVTGLFTFLQLKYISPLPKRPPPSARPGLAKPKAPTLARPLPREE